MLSVKQRIKTFTQPRNGFIPCASLQIILYDDGLSVDTEFPSYSAYASIQGLAVDYLTRFLCGAPLEQAFAISLLGAKKVGELDKANGILNQIHGLDQSSILAACKLTRYDVAHRYSMSAYSDVQNIEPDEAIVSNIKTMVHRSLSFLEKHKPMVSSGFTFEGGYTSLVSNGDGDFLTSDGLWDFKTSKNKPTSEDTLQVLIYYILGYHSVHPEFKCISTLGLFNPLLNRSYEIKIADIAEEVLRQVSHDVLGYKLRSANARWYETDGEDQEILNSFIDTIIQQNTNTDFDPQKYDDGIYDITIDDYWTYYREKSSNYIRPKFSKTDHIKFLKNSGFLMFVSISAKGTACIMQGAFLRKLDKPLEYYYDRMPEYGTRVLSLFSKYWKAIYQISHFVKKISPEYISAKVHGCIVDLDYLNHIYLNPIDGSITPYRAESMYKKEPYKNLASLISKQMPQLRRSFKKIQLEEPNALALAEISSPSALIALTDNEIVQCNEIVYDTDMYTVSKKLKALQPIYDYRLIAVWYDSLLSQQKSIGSRGQTGRR